MDILSDAKKLAKVTAIVYYLSELQKLNLITPSIGISYPNDTTNEEKLIIHRSYRKIQQLRINNLKKEISNFKSGGVAICWDEFMENKTRLNNKIIFLKEKFNPQPHLQIKKKTSINRRKLKNKKSKERYYARQMKKKIKYFSEHPERSSIINLSSHKLSMVEVYALELGYGFIPTLNDKDKEEEFLILEGLRFLDQLGKVDFSMNENNGVNSLNTPTDNHTTNEQESATFIRNRSLSSKLKFSQPKEPQPSHNITKIVIKEFNELNDRLIDKVTSGGIKKNRFNLPKIVREALFGLKRLVLDKILDIRKVDKGQKILIIDYAQRVKAEELGITSIAKICDNQTSNWLENKEFVEEKIKKIVC